MLGHCWVCCRVLPLPLWIADQVRNDVTRGVYHPRPVDSRLRGNDGEGCVERRPPGTAPLDCGPSPV